LFQAIFFEYSGNIFFTHAWQKLSRTCTTGGTPESILRQGYGKIYEERELRSDINSSI